MSLFKTCGFNELYLNDDTNIMQSKSFKIFQNPYNGHHIARLWEPGMGCFFKIVNSDLCFASVYAVLYVVSCYTGPRYSHTRL